MNQIWLENIIKEIAKDVKEIKEMLAKPTTKKK